MLSLALAVVLAGSPAPGPAPEVDVEARADALVREGKLDEAFELLEQSYYAQSEPEPRLLFGMGVIELERGNCEAAVGYLGRFLATSPAPGAAAKAREVIAYCEAQMRTPTEPKPPTEPAAAQEPAPAPPPASAAAEPQPAPSQPPVAPPDAPVGPTPWYRDGLGWGLLGTGVAVTAVGVGLLGQAQGDVRAAEASEDEASFDRSLQRVDALRAIGGSLTGVGVALLVGAAIRYGVVARRNRRAGAHAGLPGGGGPWVRTSVRF